MNRLTHERKNGIKQGYWSPNNKQELVDRLAMYEDAAEQKNGIMTLLTETICDKYCRYPVECSNQDKLDNHCDSCELVHMWNAVMCIEPDAVKINLDKFKDIDYVAKLLNEYDACPNEVCEGSPYSKHCENLIYAKPGQEINDKKLDAYCLYCTVDNRCRKISRMASWTGLTPKWCPRLREVQNEL